MTLMVREAFELSRHSVRMDSVPVEMNPRGKGKMPDPSAPVSVAGSLALPQRAGLRDASALAVRDLAGQAAWEGLYHSTSPPLTSAPSHPSSLSALHPAARCTVIAPESATFLVATNRTPFFSG